MTTREERAEEARTAAEWERADRLRGVIRATGQEIDLLAQRAQGDAATAPDYTAQALCLLIGLGLSVLEESL